MFSGAEAALWASDDGTTFVAGDQLYLVSPSGSVTTQFAAGTAWSAIWGASSSDVFAAGTGGLVRHYDGTSWSDPMATGTSADLHGLWGNGSDDVFAVGDGGTVLHYHAQLWSVIQLPSTATTRLESVGGSGTTIFVVGDSGTVDRLIETAP